MNNKKSNKQKTKRSQTNKKQQEVKQTKKQQEVKQSKHNKKSNSLLSEILRKLCLPLHYRQLLHLRMEIVRMLAIIKHSRHICVYIYEDGVHLNIVSSCLVQGGDPTVALDQEGLVPGKVIIYQAGHISELICESYL